MRYTICIIDNEIPAAGVDGIRDTDLLNSSNLQHLLIQTNVLWTDPIIKNLILALLGEIDEDGTAVWDVYAYTNPSFYINTLENSTFRSDIVTFDWDYPGTGSMTDSERLLKDILEKTFSLIIIFSKADKQAEIDSILKKPEFLEYKERIQYLDKAVNDTDQTSLLLQKAVELYNANFSFKFANILRKKAIQSADKILSDMGRASLNDIKNHIIYGESANKDFIDFLTEKFRSTIASQDIYSLIDQIPEAPQNSNPLNESILKKIWSYRLYFQRETGDDLVRCGDIVTVNNDFSFVLSADCDLSRFWKKNLGIVNMIKLHELDQTNITLRDWLTLCVKANKIPNKVPSLLGTIGELAEGPFMFPFVPTRGEIKNFLAIPKDMVSIRINNFPQNWPELNEKLRAKEAMRYQYWEGAERICTVSEPFLTPIIKHILATIAGNGVPDFNNDMQDLLKLILDDFSKSPSSELAQPVLS